MDIVATARPAIFPSYSSSLQDLRSLANALPRTLDHESLYAASALYASNVLPLHSQGASCDVGDYSSTPPASFPQRMSSQPLQRFDTPRVVSQSTATSGVPAQASQASLPAADSSHRSTQQAPVASSSFPAPSAFSRTQAASFNSSTAFPPSPHSAYSNSPNTPLGMGHASPAVASPAIDSRMIQQGSYISSYGQPQSYGTPVTAQFPGGCIPLERTQQQSTYYAGPNASFGGYQSGLHRKSSSAGSSDALGLRPYSNMSIDDARGVTHSPALFGSPRAAEAQPDQTRLAGSPNLAGRRPATAPRRASLGFSPQLGRSTYQSFSPNLGPSSMSPQAVVVSPLSDQLVIPPGHSPHVQNVALLPQGVRTDALATRTTTQSPHMSFSIPATPPAITPPSGVGLGLSPQPPNSITIIRPKAPRKPKKQLPMPEPGLSKASRGRPVPTNSDLHDGGVWDGDITAAHTKARIRERVKMRQNARAQAAGAPTPEGNAAFSGGAPGDAGAGDDASREGSTAVSPEVGAADGNDGMPTVHVVSTRSYVCPVTSCSKAFKRREHLRRHLRSIHTNEKPHKCPHAGCTKSFSRTDNLWQHVKTHEATGSGYRDVSSSETGIDVHTSNEGDAGWRDPPSPLLHNAPMLDSMNTGPFGGGGYPQFAPVHYEYSDIRQQPEPAPAHPHFMQPGMGAPHVPQQPEMWSSAPTFAPDQPTYASTSTKYYNDPGQQPYPPGRF